jgi:hypothetical protein
MHQAINSKTIMERKLWTVNATDVEWVECEHVNKTGLMVQLETQINDVTSNWIWQQRNINPTNISNPT